MGKTTCAAATALHYASEGSKTLVISTDFTPSLRHIFELAGHETPAKVNDALYVDEVGYDAIKTLWDKKFGHEVYRVFSSFVDISYKDFVDFIVSVLPGLKDEFMVDYIREITQANTFGTIVWDTAPAGQTLGLLGMPGMLNRHLKPAPRIYSSLRVMTRQKRSVLDVIRQWQDLSEKDMQFLKSEVQFNLVVIAEALAVPQLDSILTELRSYGLCISRIIINQVIEETDSPFLMTKSRMQQGYIQELERNYGISTVRLPSFPYEITGTHRLREVGERLFERGPGLPSGGSV
ncbi:MAG: ArsA family ATPase [Chloroflexi bacterium]|nr:ArsA family ATPase [Chloroflexota bacterium]